MILKALLMLREAVLLVSAALCGLAALKVVSPVFFDILWVPLVLGVCLVIIGASPIGVLMPWAAYRLNQHDDVDLTPLIVTKTAVIWALALSPGYVPPVAAYAYLTSQGMAAPVALLAAYVLLFTILPAACQATEYADAYVYRHSWLRPPYHGLHRDISRGKSLRGEG